jgi:iron complex transport system substrate-binding protein
MNKKKSLFRCVNNIFIISLFLLVFVIYPVIGDNSGTEKTITDITGEKITLNVPAERVVVANSRTLPELAAIEGDTFLDNIVGIGSELKKNDMDTYNVIEKKYPQIADIPDVGHWTDDTFNTELVISLHPDVVIFPSHLSDEAKKSKETLQKAGIPVIEVDFYTKPLENPSKSMKIYGQLFGKEERADELAVFFDNKVKTIEDTIKQRSNDLPTVYFESGSKGPNDFGSTYGKTNWGAILSAAGGKNIAADIADTSAINPEYLISQNPDYIIIGGSNWPAQADSLRLGYEATPEQSKELLKGFTSRSGWSNLNAVTSGDMYGIYQGFSQRYTNFIALEALAKWLHPDLFPDFNPDTDLKAYHDKYIPWDYSGNWFTSLN